MIFPAPAVALNFNPLSPHGERPRWKLGDMIGVSISIHSPHTGRDRDLLSGCVGLLDISIHSPHTGRDHDSPCSSLPDAISIHSPHTGRDTSGTHRALEPWISIHSPHTGRDDHGDLRQPRWGDFNPLSPHGERPRLTTIVGMHPEFQSTLPTRGETKPVEQTPEILKFQSTLPTRGETAHDDFILHACLFQSTLPTRGETSWHGARPRAMKDFNPLSPHGERLIFATTCYKSCISIHSPHTGRDAVIDIRIY